MLNGIDYNEYIDKYNISALYEDSHGGTLMVHKPSFNFQEQLGTDETECTYCMFTYNIVEDKFKQKTIIGTFVSVETNETIDTHLDLITPLLQEKTGIQPDRMFISVFEKASFTGTMYNTPIENEAN